MACAPLAFDIKELPLQDTAWPPGSANGEGEQDCKSFSSKVVLTDHSVVCNGDSQGGTDLLVIGFYSLDLSGICSKPEFIFQTQSRQQSGFKTEAYIPSNGDKRLIIPVASAQVHLCITSPSKWATAEAKPALGCYQPMTHIQQHTVRRSRVVALAIHWSETTAAARMQLVKTPHLRGDSSHRPYSHCFSVCTHLQCIAQPCCAHKHTCKSSNWEPASISWWINNFKGAVPYFAIFLNL